MIMMEEEEQKVTMKQCNRYSLSELLSRQLFLLNYDILMIMMEKEEQEVTMK
jgi:hypothetical protein